MKDFLTIVITLAITMYVVYYLVNKFAYSQYTIIEGLENKSASSDDNIAGNAGTYSSNLKASSVKILDKFLISKYRTDYENAIINADDYISAIMLQQVFKMDLTNPDSRPNIDILTTLSQLQNAKTALNSVMTFVDKQK